MRVLLQRVTRAAVAVEGQVLGAIGPGIMALVGVGPDDTAEIAAALASKSVDLRIFRDEEGRTNRSLIDVGGAALVVDREMFARLVGKASAIELMVTGRTFGFDEAKSLGIVTDVWETETHEAFIEKVLEIDAENERAREMLDELRGESE